MMEEREDMRLFWLQGTDTPRRFHRQASSICLNYGVFLIVLLVLAFTFVFVIVPSIGSFTSQILRPHSIKKSWDSLNLVLVLFAIVCGFLSRNSSSSSNESANYYEDQSLSNVQKSQPSTPSRRWLEYEDQTVSYNTLNRLRSFSSYPDLRLESLERWRFYDDTHLNNYRFSTSNDQIHHDHDHHPQQHPQEEETKKQQEEDVGAKDIDVDTFVANQKEVSYPSSPPPSPPSPPLPPSPPPPKLVRRKVKRIYQDLGHEKRTDRDQEKIFENFYNIPPPSPLPPPTPPPPPPMFSKNDKRRGKDFLISLRRKKKKQRQKSVENLEIFFNPQPSTATSTLPLIPPPSQPPPPPPPLPPHFFQNLFSKKGKTRKLHPVPPPPPPPPVTRVSKVVSQKVTPRTKVQAAAVTSHKPPKPVKTSSFNSVEESVESGNASPLIPIPPPPPPPPFKMPAWKFVLDGDYVRVESFNSSRSGSPDLDSIEDATSDKDQSSPLAAAGGSDSAAMPLFCPSPDVNTKADNFIARFRAGLKLEKVNSVKGRSNLGPEASSS